MKKQAAVAFGAMIPLGRLAALAGVLILVLVGILAGFALGRSTMREVSRGEQKIFASRPDYAVSVAEGRQDGTKWIQYAWVRGDQICTEVTINNGIESATCGHPEGLLPFWAIGIDAPVLARQEAAVGDSASSRSSIVFGIANAHVGSLQVVGRGGKTWSPMVRRCPCPGLRSPATLFSTSITRDRVAIDDSGHQYVTLVTFAEDGSEVSRLRVGVSNIGYRA